MKSMKFFRRRVRTLVTFSPPYFQGGEKGQGNKKKKGKGGRKNGY